LNSRAKRVQRVEGRRNVHDDTKRQVNAVTARAWKRRMSDALK
jgi:hypothetical protein